MFDPLDSDSTRIEIKLDRWRKLSGIIIFLENLSLSLWRPLCWVILFAGLWFLQIPSVAGLWGSALSLFIFILGLVIFTLTDLLSFKMPTRFDIDRRLENDSALSHRPLSLIDDKLSNPQKPITRKIWQYREGLVISAVNNIRPPRPRALISYIDPYSYRIAVILIFFIGIVVAGPHWQDRLHYGLYPFNFNWSQNQNDKLIIWIDPPQYTGINQFIFQGTIKSNESVKIPNGSTLKARVNGGFGKPALIMDNISLPMNQLGDSTYGIETKVLKGSRLRVKQTIFKHADIPYQLIDDSQPILQLKAPPKTLDNGQMQLQVTVKDDYGVKDMYMDLTLDPIIEDKPLGGPVTDIRAVMSPANIELELKPVYDLAWHPWAGLPTKIHLYAKDQIEQQSEIIAIDLVLPERQFYHPVAQGLIAIRKDLAWNPLKSAHDASIELENLMIYPDIFQHDIVVFLSLRTMSSRLRLDPSLKSISEVISQLWDTALRVEDGNISIAARNLKEIQRRLEQALNDPNTTDEEIADLIQDLHSAMADYFTELSRELQKRLNDGQAIPHIPEDMISQNLNSEDLSDFLSQLQSEALSGDRNSAREMLSQLQQFMDSIDPSLSMELPPDMKFMMQGLSEMQKLIEKQEELLEQTIKQAELSDSASPDYASPLPFDFNDLEAWKQGEMPPSPAPNTEQESLPSSIDTQDHKVEQDALRYVLGQLMLDADEKLGEIPKNMGLAENSMRESAHGLEKNRPDLSAPHQEQAIEHLKDSMDGMSQQLMVRMQQLNIMMLGGMGQQDPLGRPFGEGDNPGWWPGSKVKIPDQAEKKRVQEILKELRQRSGERDRPDYELEYFNRLLKQF